MLRWLTIPMLFLLSQAPADARLDGARAAAAGGPRPVVQQQEEDEGEREPGPADLDEAVEIAIERYGGEVAGANTVVREGKEVHEIRLFLDDGSVRTVRIDPETGRIIPQEREQR